MSSGTVNKVLFVGTLKNLRQSGDVWRATVRTSYRSQEGAIINEENFVLFPGDYAAQVCKIGEGQLVSLEGTIRTLQAPKGAYIREVRVTKLEPLTNGTSING